MADRDRQIDPALAGNARNNDADDLRLFVEDRPARTAKRDANVELDSIQLTGLAP